MSDSPLPPADTTAVSATTLLPEYITEAELLADPKIGCSKRTWDRWALHGAGPPRIKIGRKTLYKRSSILQWLAEREKPSRPQSRRRGGAA